MQGLKLVVKESGEHTRVTVFAGTAGMTLANCGTLTFRKEESKAFCYALVLGAVRLGSPDVEVVTESAPRLTQGA